MDEPLRILIVEDLPTDAELARREISKSLKSCAFMRVETKEDYLDALDSFLPDVIISDYRMPRFDGLTAVNLALTHAPLTPVIILTGAMNEDTAVECMKAGAVDYVIKEHIKRLGQAVIHALEERDMKRERKRAEEEKARLEEQLLQSRKIESLGRLAGGVAHDFNNMLTVILGNVELMKRRLPENDDLLRNVGEIERAALQSQAVARQLLSFSRKEVIEPRVIDLNELISASRETLAGLLGEDIDLRFYGEGGLWHISADPSQVDRILVNLALNSRDAMPRGGHLVIETSNAHSKEGPQAGPGDYVLLSVTDDGMGMDKTTIDHLFEPFFTTKDIGKGTGLGLATVYGIASQNGGFVEVESEPGRGTRFKVYFPRHEGEAAPSQAGVPEAPALAGPASILLVEDNEMVRDMVATMLDAMGQTVIVARTPFEALSLCEEGETKIDLLLTDVVMPGMSGKELRDRVREAAPRVKVLFMSGYTADVVISREGLEEQVHFIQKPFGPEGLARKIGEALAGEREKG